MIPDFHDSVAEVGSRSSAASTDGSAPTHCDRIEVVRQMLSDISRLTDPQEVVARFGQETQALFGHEEFVSLSRRGLEFPDYRITRSSLWKTAVNPWKEPNKLPLLSGGVIADWLYNDRALLINEFTLDENDPAFTYLKDARSVAVIPMFDGGAALNMVVRYASRDHHFREEEFADILLQTNLFGRTTHGLVLAQRLRSAYDALDRELEQVGRIQRQLLPARLPDIPGLDIAANYETAQRAGGDYYDFFELDGGRWGVLIADVSGHGTPAAVVMAILRTILHTTCTSRSSPADVLAFANNQLISRDGEFDGSFVTAFYGVYDPRTRTLTYSGAGHNPPLHVDGELRVQELADAQGIPLGIDANARFAETTVSLSSGDTLILFTDGITEAINDHGEMYGSRRLVACVREDVRFAQEIVDCITHRLLAFTGGKRQEDDQTIVALKVQ